MKRSEGLKIDSMLNLGFLGLQIRPLKPLPATKTDIMIALKPGITRAILLGDKEIEVYLPGTIGTIHLSNADHGRKPRVTFWQSNIAGWKMDPLEVYQIRILQILNSINQQVN